MQRTRHAVPLLEQSIESFKGRSPVAPSLMVLESSPERDMVKVAVHGAPDAVDPVAFEELLLRLGAQSRVVIVDLRRPVGIDPWVGIVLGRVGRELAARDGELRIVSASPDARSELASWEVADSVPLVATASGAGW